MDGPASLPSVTSESQCELFTWDMHVTCPFIQYVPSSAAERASFPLLASRLRAGPAVEEVHPSREACLLSLLFELFPQPSVPLRLDATSTVPRHLYKARLRIQHAATSCFGTVWTPLEPPLQSEHLRGMLPHEDTGVDWRSRPRGKACSSSIIGIISQSHRGNQFADCYQTWELLGSLPISFNLSCQQHVLPTVQLHITPMIRAFL